MSNFEPPVGMCPECECDGVRSYGVLSKNGLEITCPRGHVFSDMNDFNEGVTKQERKKMKKETDKRTEDLFGSTRQIDPEAVPAIIQKNPSDMSIDDVNKARLETLVGQFSDISGLVGLIYSALQEKKDLEEMIRNAKKAKVGEEDGKVLPSGDLQFSGVIPERHVQPLIDLSHSWNRNVTDYVNERLIELFDNMLFY
jgi:hypothetical protein